jgi:PAS domain S-box-containing protein
MPPNAREMKARIVVIHSDSAIAGDLCDRLRKAGHAVDAPLQSWPADVGWADVLVVESSLARAGIRLGARVILIAPEGYRVSDKSDMVADAVVLAPVRCGEVENAVELLLRRGHTNHDSTVVQNIRQYAIYMLDANGFIVSWNPGAVAVHGFEPDEAIGQHFSILYTDQDRASNVPENELRLAAAEGVADDTRWLLRKGGEPFWAEGVTAAVKSDTDDVIGYAKVTRDATERRKLDQQLERSNDELQRFAYTVSHDLQEPLRTVRSYAELLSRRYAGKLDSDADEFIHFMVDAAGRMTQLLKDLLAYSQAGRPDRTRPEPTQASNILQWAIMNVDRLVKDTGAVITYDPLPMVEVDQTQLSQVFQNLLGNSIKYRGPEPPKIHVSARRTDGFHEFSVSDNGIGVDPEHHDRIFGVFKRLHGKDVPGTGIGLAICRKIIESHGGQIWIESRLGQGATFKFTLPAYDQ